MSSNRLLDMGLQLTKKALARSDCYTIKGRKAAKEHNCNACDRRYSKIEKGELYIEQIRSSARNFSSRWYSGNTSRFHTACAGGFWGLVELIPTPTPTTDQKNRRHAALLHTQRKVAARRVS